MRTSSEGAYLHLVHELAEDIRHERPLAVAQHVLAVEEQVGDSFDERAPARQRLVAREFQQMVAVAFGHLIDIRKRDLYSVKFACPGAALLAIRNGSLRPVFRSHEGERVIVGRRAPRCRGRCHGGAPKSGQ
jgi:hypothetical protein